STNLEVFLSTLHSLAFYHSNKTISPNDCESEGNEKAVPGTDTVKRFENMNDAEKITAIILKARNFLLQKCLNEDNAKPEKEEPPVDLPLIELYKQFYKKLLARNSTLPRLNIFTTN